MLDGMTQEKISETLLRTLYGALLGIAYAALALSQQAQLTSALVGMAIGALTALLDKWVFTGRLRRRRFATVLLVRTFAYLLVIVLSVVLVGGLAIKLQTGQSWRAVWNLSHLKGLLKGGEFVEVVIFSFVILLFVQFIAMVSRLLGRNRLVNYVLGRYFHPKEEERIFMFMDIKSSTHLAEKLGHFKWHRLLNDFFFDIADPIRQCKGEIYQYVGDEVVVTWPKKKGIQHLNCIRCFFLIEDKMQARRERYIQRYGYAPMFKAGYHLGKVVAGEIGDFKREIVFHGDTINTASRIQQETNNIGRRLLLSANLLKELNLDDQYREEYIGIIRLRGKEKEITLFSIDLVEESPGKRNRQPLKKSSGPR